VNSLPNTNAVDIALGKKAKIISGSEMPSFFANKLKTLGGDPKLSELVRFGASRKVGGITMTTVPAVHSNGISGHMIGGDLGDMLNAAGLTAYAGPPTGFVLTFSNGLVVYLSGDTGITAEQETVVKDHYKAQLVVINIGDTFTTGPAEAAWVVNKLIKPQSVIVSHANQPSTEAGKVIAGSRVDQFSKLSKVPVHVPLSGRAMSFDAKGKCTGGC
jgi:L-ascorbate metabolism protein UlaG (beta-lactamase superfamily)